MQRGLKYKLGFLIALVVACIILLVPTIYSTFVKTETPEWYTESVYGGELNLGLDLQGGLLLQYQVDTQKAVGDQTNEYAHDLATRIQDKDSSISAHVIIKNESADDVSFNTPKYSAYNLLVIRDEAETNIDTIKLMFKDEEKTSLIDNELMGFYPLETTSSSDNTVTLTIYEQYIEQTEQYAMEQAIETIRSRVDAFGLTEPSITKRGGRDIVVQMPGLKETEFYKAKNLIGQTAQLTFKIVDSKETNALMTELEKQLPNDGSIELITAEGLYYLKAIDPSPYESRTDEKRATNNILKGKFKVYFDPNQWPSYKEEIRTGIVRKSTTGRDILVNFLRGKVPEGHQFGFESVMIKEPTSGRITGRYWKSWYMFSKTEVRGEDLSDTRVAVDSRDQRPYVSLTFNTEGAKKFGNTTTEYDQELMAIMLDNEVKSAPRINEPILGGRASITLGNTLDMQEMYEDANNLVIVLRHGALPAPIHKEFETQVGPSLGEDSVRSGRMAAVIGLIFVMIFMAFYYRLSGVFADISLTVNIVLVLAVLTLFGATLTLPGIAGIVLTIGMAVDANVIIFERIREEVRLGKTLRDSISGGYAKALWTILDANITTGIAAVVLMQYGSGPIKGFAVTLLIGICTSVFAALFITRLLQDIIVNRSNIEKLSI